MNAYLRYLALGVGIFFAQNAHSESISFSQLLHDVDRGQVHDVLIEGPSISGTFNDGRSFDTYAPDDPTLVQRLYAKGVAVTAQAPSPNAPWYVSLLVTWLPLVAIIGV
jgi:cell division protease FtsH